jgi:serine protease Do
MKHVFRSLVAIVSLVFLVAVPLRAGDLPDFREIVRKNSGAVVKILSTQRSQAQGGMPQDIDPRYLEQLPDIFRHLYEQRGQRQPRERRASGSGFVTSPDGYILTNHHVVDGADEVIVRLIDRREFEAKVIGTDKRSDIALLKIDATGLQAVTLGDSEALAVGEWVLAIGSPFGLDYSVTAGIVSARGRSLPTETGDNYVPFIQTDVAINPGNSGGPLINMRGEVVGINSQIYSRSGGFMGISFAIPMDEAMRVSEQLRSNGRVSRGRIGVQIAPVTKEVAETIGLGKAQGVLVRGVEEGSPAEKAGLEAGDIITRFDGKPIDKPADLPRAVGNTKPGSKVAITVFRRGGLRDLNITVAEVEAEKVASATPEKKAPAASAQHWGLTVSDLTESQKRELRVRGGVRVDAAADAAARAGIREGDLILAIANTEVTSLKEFELIMSRVDKTRPASVLIRRGDGAQYVLIRPLQ